MEIGNCLERDLGEYLEELDEALEHKVYTYRKQFKTKGEAAGMMSEVFVLQPVIGLEGEYVGTILKGKH